MSEEQLKELQEYNLEYLEAQQSEEIFGGDYTSAVELKYAKKEIERLKEDNEYLNKVNIELSTEKNRLNNIINELEKYIVIKLKEFNNPEEYYTLKQIDDIHYRLQELKGSDKE